MIDHKTATKQDLLTVAKGCVDQSLETLDMDAIGRMKLLSRANKLRRKATKKGN
jgi:hypothetical protein